MPLIIDKVTRPSVLKKSKADKEAESAYTGVKKTKNDPFAFRKGIQVGIVMGEDTGKYCGEKGSKS